MDTWENRRSGTWDWYIVGDSTLEMDYVQSDVGPKQASRDPGPTSGVVQ